MSCVRDPRWLVLAALMLGSGCVRPPAVIVEMSAAHGGAGVVCVVDGRPVPPDGLRAALGERLQVRHARPPELHVGSDLATADWVGVLQDLREAGATAALVSTSASVQGTPVRILLPVMLTGKLSAAGSGAGTNRFTSLLSFRERVAWIQLVRSNGVCRSTLDQRLLTDDAKQRELRAAAAPKPGRRVVIHAARETTAADLASLLLELREDGLSRMTVAVPATQHSSRGFLVLPFEINGKARVVRPR